MHQNMLIISMLLAMCLPNCNSFKSAKSEIHGNTCDNAALIKYPDTPSAKAVVLVIHGLNLKPTRMDDWSNLLASHGAIIIRPALLGHCGGQSDEMLSVNSDIWRDQFKHYVEMAKDLSAKHNVPMMFLGYSLGGLLGVEWLSQQISLNESFKKVVLLAPAISIPWYSQPAVKLFDRTNFIVPSPSPGAFKATRGSSVNAYKALVSLKNALEASDYKNTNLDTLILMDKHDELISSNQIKEIITHHGLSRWHLELVDNTYAYKNHGYRHLMVDRDSVGPELWRDLSQKVIQHFNL